MFSVLVTVDSSVLERMNSRYDIFLIGMASPPLVGGMTNEDTLSADETAKSVTQPTTHY